MVSSSPKAVRAPFRNDLPNMFATAAESHRTGRVSLLAPWLILPARMLLFAVIQALAAGWYAYAGSADAWQESVRWWPVTVVLANLILLIILQGLVKKEGLSLIDLWGIEPSRLGHDVVYGLGLTLLGFLVVVIGHVGAGALLYGDQAPLYLYPLPMWAAPISLATFPLTIALAELATYLAYSQTRLEALTGNRAAALILTAFWLAAQHCMLPLIFDIKFILYRFLMMLPAALFAGLVYRNSGRLFPLMVMQFLLHFILGVMIYILSLP